MGEPDADHVPNGPVKQDWEAGGAYVPAMQGEQLAPLVPHVPALQEAQTPESG